jgi:hypothetical protein
VKKVPSLVWLSPTTWHAVVYETKFPEFCGAFGDE